MKQLISTKIQKQPSGFLHLPQMLSLEPARKLVTFHNVIFEKYRLKKTQTIYMEHLGLRAARHTLELQVVRGN